MRAEAWEKAVKSFQNAIAIDPTFEVPYYGLGRAYMALKKFDFAIVAYEKCRDLYRGQAGRQFTNAAGGAALPAGSHYRDRRADPHDAVGPR